MYEVPGERLTELTDGIARLQRQLSERDALILELRRQLAGALAMTAGHLAAELDGAPALGQYSLLLGRIGALEDANADLTASKNRVTAALSEARAEITGLRAVLRERAR